MRGGEPSLKISTVLYRSRQWTLKSLMALDTEDSECLPAPVLQVLEEDSMEVRAAINAALDCCNAR